RRALDTGASPGGCLTPSLIVLKYLAEEPTCVSPAARRTAAAEASTAARKAAAAAAPATAGAATRPAAAGDAGQRRMLRLQLLAPGLDPVPQGREEQDPGGARHDAAVGRKDEGRERGVEGHQEDVEKPTHGGRRQDGHQRVNADDEREDGAHEEAPGHI